MNIWTTNYQTSAIYSTLSFLILIICIISDSNTYYLSNYPKLYYLSYMNPTYKYNINLYVYYQTYAILSIISFLFQLILILCYIIYPIHYESNLFKYSINLYIYYQTYAILHMLYLCYIILYYYQNHPILFDSNLLYLTI